MLKSENMKLVVANWKNNLPDLEGWKNFPKFSSEVVICPRETELETVKQNVPNVELGLQDVPTGEAEDYVKFIIAGHSDRRRAGDTDEIVNQKLKKVLGAGRIAILCIGETRAAKDSGQAEEFIKTQTEGCLRDVSTEKFKNIVVAYEPVWAISTEPGGEADTPGHALEMVRFIKGLSPAFSNSRFVYGGSVNPENVSGYLQNPEIEGALVGAASLDVEKFKKLISIADACNS